MKSCKFFFLAALVAISLTFPGILWAQALNGLDSNGVSSKYVINESDPTASEFEPANNGGQAPSGASTEAPAASSDGSWVGEVTSSSLNIRVIPWGEVKEKLSRGTRVQVLGTCEEDAQWYRIKTPSGATLCAHSNYISRVRTTSSGTNGSNGAAVSFTDGAINSRILSAARSLESENINYPPECGKDRNGNPSTPGNLGCAHVVSLALQRAGINVYSMGVTDLASKLQTRPTPGFTTVPEDQRQAGDVVVWNPSHIGIIAEPGRAISNSSSKSRVIEHEDTYKTIRMILRAPQN